MNKSRVFDCFLYSGELELLNIRLEYYNDFVDYFVIVEGESTFQGIIKDELLNLDILPISKEKILYVKVPHNDLIGLNSSREKESLHRSYFFSALANCNDDDLVFISDVDEFYFKDRIRIESIDKFYRLEFDFSYFYLNYQCLSIFWLSSFVCRYSFLKGKDIDDLRFRPELFGDFSVLKNAGIHLSYLGDFKRFLWKIDNLADDWLIDFKNYTEEELIRKLRYGLDIYDRNELWLAIDIKSLNYPNDFLAFFDKKFMLDSSVKRSRAVFNVIFYFVAARKLFRLFIYIRKKIFRIWLKF